MTLVGLPQTSVCLEFSKQGEETISFNAAACGAPTADAGPDLVFECTSPVGASVSLDGLASSDPNSSPGTNDDIILFEWFEDFGLPTESLLGTEEILTVTLPLGIHLVTLRVTDSFGETDTDEVVIK